MSRNNSDGIVSETSVYCDAERFTVVSMLTR